MVQLGVGIKVVSRNEKLTKYKSMSKRVFGSLEMFNTPATSW